MLQGRKEAHVFPSDDEMLRAVVAKTMELYEPPTPDELAALLRPAFPGVDVDRRDALATIAGDTTEVWYVFRDGRAVPDMGSL